ncbi:MAG: GTP-binding protein [Tepidisphaeraceae bacterium]|jgi:hydrogenase nickel incorporation protein HypB
MTQFDPENAGQRNIKGPPPAAMIRKQLAQAHILAVRLIGHPGSGKTQLIDATLRRLPAPQRVAVIAVNPASSRDADRLRGLCGFVGHIDAAAPDAASILRITSQCQLENFDILLIETAGGLGALPDLGQDATVAVFAVSGGDDKAAEYSTLLKAASAAVLTKIDLHPMVKFDEGVFRRDVKNINPSAEIHALSAVSGAGMSSWLAWLDRKRIEKRSRDANAAAEHYNETFIG